MARRRRTLGRHGRRAGRLTPRRWLPMLAMIALIAAGVVLINGGDGPTPPRQPATPIAASASGLLPVAAVPRALATAWYCAGGTARGDGPAELTVVIANESPSGTTAALVVTGSDDGQVERSTVDVPARGVKRVKASDLLEARWAAVTVEVLGGRASVSREVSGPNGFDSSPCSTQASRRWYAPSGSTVRGADAVLVLYNPFPGPTSVDIRFATDEGPRSPRSLQGLSIPAGSLRVLGTDDLPSRRPEIATEVVARTGRIVVDRVQIYRGTGDPIGGDGQGATTSVEAPEGVAAAAAIPALSSRWVIPDAVITGDSRRQIAVYNPGDRTAEIDVVIAYERPDRAPEIEPIALTVRPGEERNLDLDDQDQITPDLPFSIELRSLEGVPVAAEMLVFGAVAPAPSGPDDAPAGGGDGEEPPGDAVVPSDAEAVAGFAVVPASPIAASSWILADRGGAKRTGGVVVVNPGRTATTVRVQQLDAGRRSPVPSATVRIPPGDRRSLDLTDAKGRAPLLIDATGAVVASALEVGADGGLSASLLTPWPETVVELPPVAGGGA